MSNDSTNRRILVIDDSRAIHEDFKKILTPPYAANGLDEVEAALFEDERPGNSSPPFELAFATQGEEGMKRVSRAIDAGRPYAMAFVDMRMPPGWDGMQTIEQIWRKDENIQVVICTAYSEYSWDDVRRRLGDDDRLLILKKPFDNAEVYQLASSLTEKWRLGVQARLKMSELEQIVSCRTAELQTTNAQLNQEIVVRKQAEEQLTAFIRDISARKQTEVELRLAKDVAETASGAKSQFLANMSHEIRTPMTAILGYADMLLEPGQTDSDRVERVQIIRRNGEHLLAILDDILDLSKIEAGKLEVERIAFDPSEVVSDVVSLMRVRSLDKGITIDVTYDGEIPQRVCSDPTRLRQILINLIGNAIKFTASGGVKVLVTLAQNQNREPQLQFAVVDSGIGMDSDQLLQLFDPFEQADNSTTRRFGGTGLGLSICKQLAQLLGGDITVQSRPAVGSRFIVTIDAGDLSGVPLVRHDREVVRSPKALAEPPRVLPLNGRILLAEDGVHNQRVIAYYLKQAGAEVAVADNGQIACDMASDSLATGRPFEVILMDMQMPVMDGYTAAATLRARGWQGSIIALTAHAMSHDRARCIKAGCTDYVPKAIDRDLLLSTVARHLRKPTVLPAMGIAGEPAPDPSAEGRTAATQLRSTLLNDVDMAQFVPAFIADLPALVGRLQRLLEEQNLGEVRQVLHQLKGTAGLYGFMPLTDAAERLEHTAIDTKTADMLAAEVKSLVNLIRRVEGYEMSKEAAVPAKELR
jgi:two-component system, sensor histidine kinase and response regulator